MGLLLHWHLELLVHLHVELLLHWHLELLVHLHVELLLYWHLELLVHLHVELLLYWHLELLSHLHVELLFCTGIRLYLYTCMWSYFSALAFGVTFALACGVTFGVCRVCHVVLLLHWHIWCYLCTCLQVKNVLCFCILGPQQLFFSQGVEITITGNQIEQQ